MQLWLNGSLKVPLRPFEGLQAGRKLLRAALEVFSNLVSATESPPA